MKNEKYLPLFIAHPDMEGLELGSPEYAAAFAALRQRDQLPVAIAYYDGVLAGRAAAELCKVDAAPMPPAHLLSMARAYLSGAQLDSTQLACLDALSTEPVGPDTRASSVERLLAAAEPHLRIAAITFGARLAFRAEAPRKNTFEEIEVLATTLQLDVETRVDAFLAEV